MADMKLWRMRFRPGVQSTLVVLEGAILASALYLALMPEFAPATVDRLRESEWMWGAPVFLLLFLALLVQLLRRVPGFMARRMAEYPDEWITPALLVRRRRLEREVRADLQSRIARWELEREDWKYQKTSELYEQIMDQFDRGVVCAHCKECGECSPN
ncbi:hypothetical protein [Streptomyces antarcticus]|uniref:hypothetical protein n=1 Tax=Streptomyces antarcticus TaxID=2996458 RepID=UPI00226E31A6|nr:MULTISPECIES: hypothetical protein [unclassified Streptomyces]MCY0943575.1 hypothetical protein [Streptomyces sp. H34-AA3]MCZ4083516.1 hypothetical protein [Streptomyces sp. H34-S5]